MRQIVRVLTCNPDGTALVACIRKSACTGACESCGGCGAAEQTVLLTVKNPIGAQPGALVTVETRSGVVLAAAARLYAMPLALFFAGYLAGELLWQKGTPVACLAFIAGVLGAVGYSRLAGKKKLEYTITGYACAPHRREEGDQES